MTYTNKIFELTSPYDNPYQGTYQRLLFVCTVGLLRSPTAATLAAKLGFNARSCGSDVNCALIPISVNLVYWADRIIFLNSANEFEATQAFFGDTETLRELDRKSEVWDIEDDYEYMNTRLVQLIEERLKNVSNNESI